jgi:hypothetical protein
MVTIHSLEVRMDVQGGGSADEAAFVRLFNKYIKAWNEEQTKQKHRTRRVAQERALGDRPAGEEEGA